MSGLVAIRQYHIVLLLTLPVPGPKSADFSISFHSKDPDLTPSCLIHSNKDLNTFLLDPTIAMLLVDYFSVGNTCNQLKVTPEKWLKATDCGGSKSHSNSSEEKYLQVHNVSVPGIWNTFEIKCNNLNVLFQVRKEQSSADVFTLQVAFDSGNRELFWDRFKHCATRQLSTGARVPSSCRQSMREIEKLDFSTTHTLPLFQIDITIVFMQLQLTFISSDDQVNAGVSHSPYKMEPRQKSVSDVESKPTEAVHELPQVSQKCIKGRVSEYQFWSKLFKLSDSVTSTEEETIPYSGETSISVLHAVLREMLLSLMTMMIFVFRYLPQSFEADKTKKLNNAVYLRILTKSFFLKWTWHQKQSLSSNEDPKQSGHAQKGEQFSWPKSDLLSSYIFRPWMTKAFPSQHQACPSHCVSSTSPLCCECQHRLSTLPTHPPPLTLHVHPAFLPDPTRNPSLDLAHVGYRLATLAALPPSFPVSRIKMADAGFYFRGHEDEVRCYSCDVHRSGWQREDNPMAIHRELSPTCPHVLQCDRELFTPTPRSQPPSSQNGTNNDHASSHGHTTQTQNLNNLAEHHSPEEDSEGLRPSSIPALNREEEGHTSTTQSGRPEIPGQNGSSPMYNHSASLVGSGTAPTGTAANGGSAVALSAESGSALNGEVRSAVTAGPGSSISEGSRSAINTQSISNNAEGNRNGSISSTTAPSIHSPNNTTSQFSAPRATSSPSTTTTTTVVPASDASSRTQAASHSSQVTLFPRARLDLGGAVYPMFQSIASRRQTFRRWDDSRAPPLQEIVLAGMFYAGYADCVRCFYCGVGLKHWEVTDDVWDEHVRWRPECRYLRAVKGDHFIRETQRRLGVLTETSATSQGQPPPSPPAIRTDNSPSSGPITPTQHTSSSYPSLPSSLRANNGATTTTTPTSIPHPPPRSTSAGNGGRVGEERTAATSCGRTSERREAGEGAGRVVVSNAAEGPGTLRRLQREHQELSRRFNCAVCHGAAIDTILLPCGHLVLCESCAGSVTSCPRCQARIMATAKVHFAE